MGVGAAAGKASGKERERAQRQLKLWTPEQADREQAEKKQERTTEHRRAQEQQAGQEQAKTGDMRALEHCRLAAAPPSAEGRTPIVRPEYHRGEPPTDPCNKHPQA